MAKKIKLPADLSKRAKSIVDIATGESEATNKETEGNNPAAVKLGRLGGLKGDKARANRLSTINGTPKDCCRIFTSAPS